MSKINHKKFVWEGKVLRHTKNDVMHTDVDEFEIIGQQFDHLRLNTHAREAPMGVATRMAGIHTANAIAEGNGAAAGALMEWLLRTDPFVHEPWLLPLSRDWVSENVSLIKSIGEKHLTEVEHLIYRMARQGESIKTIRAELEDRFGVTKNRARLIARDQVNKYNGQLTQERQVRAGISMYRWRNMQDRRVRGWPGGLYAKAVPSHAVMEGVLCRWDDRTVYFDENKRRWKKRTTLMEKLHPGQPIQDRCYAEPVLTDV